jgi:tetratricopeptide (TPR) repeat protein
LSQTYDRKLDDIFKIQDDIAGEVVKALKVSLMEVVMPRASGTKNTEAYALYLQGRAIFIQAGTPAEIEKAADYLRQALKLDPTFAPAWVWLSAVHINQAEVVMPRQQAFAEARHEAGKGLALDPNLSIAHSEMVERHALAPQFAMYGRPIGFRTDLARGRCRRIQPCFQFDLAQTRRQRVAQSALLRPAKNLAHRRRRTADHPGNLTMASASLVRQP